MLMVDDLNRADIRHRVAHERQKRAAGAFHGYEAIATAVIMRAWMDALGNDLLLAADALAYFAGPVFRQHRELVGLSDDWLPEGVTHVS